MESVQYCLIFRRLSSGFSFFGKIYFQFCVRWMINSEDILQPVEQTLHLHFGFNFCEKWNPSNFGDELLGRLKICWTLFNTRQISDSVFGFDSYVITYISGFLVNIVIKNECIFCF